MRVAETVPSDGDLRCRACGATHPALFFAQGMTWCRSCTSDYDVRRRAAAQQRDPVAEQECLRCKRLLPASAFHLQLFSPTGLDSQCKPCRTKALQESRALTAAAPLPAAAQPSIKECPTCNTRLPRAAFHKVKSTWNGLRVECKSCTSDRYRKRQAARKQQ